MKEKLLNIFLALIIGISTFVSFFQLNQDYIIAQDDSMRHNQFAYNINKYGFIENDTNHNWGNVLVSSYLNENNVDLWQGHHLFLSLLLKAGVEKEDLNKYYITICVILLVLLLLSFNSKINNPKIIGLGVIFFVFFVNSDSYSRILLSRPYLLTTIFFLSIIYVLYLERYFLLIFIFLLASFYHFLFYILFFPIIIYLFVLNKGYKTNLKILSYGFLGALCGILIHTKSILYVKLGLISLFGIPFLQKFSNIIVGELDTYNGMNMYGLMVFFVLLGAYVFILNKVKDSVGNLIKNRFLLYLNIMTIILFILSIFIYRFIDFFVVSLSVAILFLIRELINVEGITISKKNNILCSFLIIILFFLFQTIVMSTNNKMNNYIGETKKVILDTKKYLKSGSVIASNNTYDFYKFYYYLSDEYKYLMSMEIMYIYMNNKQTYSDLKDVLNIYKFKPKNKDLDLFNVLKSHNVKYYYILDGSLPYVLKRSLDSEIEKINKDKNFKLLYKYKENYLWELK